MDNSNPAAQTTPDPIANTVPPEPIVPQVSIQNTSSGGDSKKIILWLVVGLVVVMGLVGGIYFFLSQQQPTNSSMKPSEQVVVKATPKPPVDTVDALDRDLNAVNIASSEADFIPVDQDLQQL